MLGSEFSVRVAVIRTDAQNDSILPLEGGRLIAKGAGLLRAAAGVVLGVEVEHDPLAAVFAQPLRLTTLIGQCESGRYPS